MGGQAGLGTQFELGRGLGSDREGREAGKDGGRAGDSGCQEAQGCERGLPPGHLPQGQQPTCAVFFYAENMKTKVFHVNQRGKKSEALKPRDAPLGPHPTHASASGCGLQDKLHFFHIRNERLTEEKAVSQSQSDHLTSGQRESRWAEISEPGKPSEENSGLEFRRIWEP